MKAGRVGSPQGDPRAAAGWRWGQRRAGAHQLGAAPETAGSTEHSRFDAHTP